MGASQILFLDVAPHAAVKETVDAIKLPYGGGESGSPTCGEVRKSCIEEGSEGGEGYSGLSNFVVRHRIGMVDARVGNELGCQPSLPHLSLDDEEARRRHPNGRGFHVVRVPSSRL